MTERGTLLRTVRKRLKLRQVDVAVRAGYAERTYRSAETSGENVSDKAWVDFAQTLSRELPAKEPSVAALARILELPGPPERRPSYAERVLALGEHVASRQFGLGPLLAAFLLGCAVGVGLLSAALWVIVYGHLGGSQEPHGVVAVSWLVVTAGPARLRECVLVLIWAFLIAGGGFGLQQLTARLRHGAALRQHMLWRTALAVLTTAVPVWAFVARFGDDQEGARGVVAGVALRLGLALAVLFQPSAPREAEASAIREVAQ